MKVLTNNPVIVDNTRISKPSEYLAFDGKNSNEVKAFQDWMDMTNPTWYKGGTFNKGRGYGKMTRLTKKAANQYGKQFDSAGGSRKMIGTVNPTTGEFTPPPPEGYTMQSPDGQTKKGQFWNKAKGGWEKAGGVLEKAQKGFDFLNQFFGQQGRGGASDVTQDQGGYVAPDNDFEPEKDGMSKNLKIGLIVGSVAAAALITVLIVRSVKKGKAKGKAKK
jgi:hypothetical protein